jgi:excisionase family DNA binding protein
MNEEDPDIMTADEVAELLHIHPTTVYRLVKQRRIPAFRVGGDYRFNREAIDHWRLYGAQNK